MAEERKEYRVVRHFQDGLPFFMVHEVYIDKSGDPIAIESGSATPFGETIEEFQQDLQRFNEAAASLPLDYDLFPTRGTIPWP